jgi:hypothetical protein
MNTQRSQHYGAAFTISPLVSNPSCPQRVVSYVVLFRSTEGAFVYFVQESSNPPVSPICFTITSIGLDLSFSAMAVVIDQRVVVEEALVDVHAPDTYRSPLAQPPLPWVETQPSRPERNLVSWALSGTYDEETPVSIAAYKRNC